MLALALPLTSTSTLAFGALLRDDPEQGAQRIDLLHPGGVAVFVLLRFLSVSGPSPSRR